MEHVEGINWQVVHELLVAELKRMDEHESSYFGQWWRDEFNRMNDLAIEKAMEQQ